MSNDFPIVVMLSGRGSNFRALLESPYKLPIVGVVSDKPEAQGLAIAREAGIPTKAMARSEYPSKIAHKESLYAAVEEFRPRLIVLAGFMQIVESFFVEKHFGEIVNIHPSLLPRHPGLHTHERAIESGDKEHGCTVHFVDSGVDTGPLIAQAATNTAPGESSDELAARVLKLEHTLFAWVIHHLVKGGIVLRGRSVSISDEVRQEGEARNVRFPRA